MKIKRFLFALPVLVLASNVAFAQSSLTNHISSSEPAYSFTFTNGSLQKINEVEMQITTDTGAVYKDIQHTIRKPYGRWGSTKGSYSSDEIINAFTYGNTKSLTATILSVNGVKTEASCSSAPVALQPIVNGKTAHVSVLYLGNGKCTSTINSN